MRFTLPTHSLTSLVAVATAVPALMTPALVSAAPARTAAVPTAASTTGATPTTHRMTVAPTSVTTADRTVYQARSGFEGGGYNEWLYHRTADIKGTADDALYHPEWFKPRAWRKPIVNGTYEVTLKMREAYFHRAGQRVFSVDAEGRRVLTDIDIVKEVGTHAAYDRTFPVTVQDGRLDLEFSAKADGAVLSAIVVRPTTGSVAQPVTPPKTSPTPAPLGVGGAWKVAMRDEFDGSTLNTSLWTPHRGLPPYTYGHPYNANLDGYAFDPSRVSVRNGALRLSWDKTPTTVRNHDGSTTTYPYAAGVAHSGRGFSFAHGYIEARIRVPDTPGLWPAFWMLPMEVDQGWPPEIDIAELVPDDTPDGTYKPHFNYHWKDAAGTNRQAHWKWYGQEGRSYAGSWHTYGLLWEEGRLQVFLDGVPGPSYSGSEVTSNPMYVVLSSGVRKGYSPPAGAMEVDYVRVWKRG